MAKFKHISGHCAHGFHEGDAPVDAKGVAQYVCVSWTKDSWGAMCYCGCHEKITKMYEAAGLPRLPMQNPAYKPERNYVMPTAEERIQAHAEARAAAAVKQEELPLEVVEPANYSQTPTGRRARGQLEDQVLLVCSQFVRGEIEVEALTTSEIATRIDPADPPSVGAIAAIFNRWTTIGFARIEKKPIRFETFTAEGMERGLQYLKEKHRDKLRKSKMVPASDVLRRKR